MSFQKKVNRELAIGVVGARASMNPVSTVLAGPGGLVATTGGVYVGRFAWNTYATAGGPGKAANSCLTGKKPDGFIANEMNASIVNVGGSNSLLVPGGMPVTEFDRGDFLAYATFGEADIDDKVFANLFTGQIKADAAGAFPVDVAGSASVINGTATLGDCTLTVGTVTSGVLAVGQLISGTGIDEGTYIDKLGNGSGSTGTYILSKPVIATLAGSETLTTVAPEGVGGGTMVCDANNNSKTLTIGTVTSGVVAAGMLVSGTSIPSGTYVAALGTSSGVAGTLTLSANTTGTISAASVKFSPWIETDWSVKSAANAMELVKIGIKG